MTTSTRMSRWKICLAAAAAGAAIPVAAGALPAAAASADIRITEVAPRASSTPLGHDWFELTNTGSATVNITGWRVDDDSNAFNKSVAISGVTSIAPGESVVIVTEATSSVVSTFRTAWFGAAASTVQIGWADGSGLGLGNDGDAVNIFDASGTRVANVTFGAAPAAAPYATFDNAAGVNGAITAASVVGTNGAFASANGAEIGSPGLVSGGAPTDPPPATTFTAWPGSPNVVPAEDYDFGNDMSGLDYEPSGPTTGVLWAARNKAGTMFRLVLDVNDNWVPDGADGWAAGKELRYPGGTGHPDSEGITISGSSSADGVYIASERNNDNSGVSRNSVLRYDVSGTGTSLSATAEWNLTADLPATGANLGLEAITWIDDATLVAAGFVDESTGLAYDPANYPGHGDGVFLVALEQTGGIYAYALQADGGFTRLATIASGLTIVTDLQYDGERQQLWAECDNTCNGRLTVLELEQGAFVIRHRYERPANLGNNNNEGFAITPLSQCAAGERPVYWADDDATGGVSIVRGSLSCDGGPEPVIPEFPISGALAATSALALLGGWALLRRRRDAVPA